VRPHTVATDRDEPVQVAENLPSAQAEPVQLRQVGGIFEYMAERVRPSPSSSVRGRDLHADYAGWCEVGERATLSQKEFFDEFERICAEELSGSIRRVGNHYVGLVLADALKALPTQRVG